VWLKHVAQKLGLPNCQMSNSRTMLGYLVLLASLSLARGDHHDIVDNLIAFVMGVIIICMGVCFFCAICAFPGAAAGTAASAALVPQQNTSSAYPQPSVQMLQQARTQSKPGVSLACHIPSAPLQPAVAPMQPAMVPEQPATAPGGNLFQVAVPAGCAGGSTVMVDAPNGKRMQIVVPAGLQAGQAFVAAY